MNIKLDSILGVLREDDKPTAELGALDLRVTAVEAGEGIVNTMILVEGQSQPTGGTLNHGILLTTTESSTPYVCCQTGRG